MIKQNHFQTPLAISYGMMACLHSWKFSLASKSWSYLHWQGQTQTMILPYCQRALVLLDSQVMNTSMGEANAFYGQHMSSLNKLLGKQSGKIAWLQGTPLRLQGTQFSNGWLLGPWCAATEPFYRIKQQGSKCGIWLLHNGKSPFNHKTKHFQADFFLWKRKINFVCFVLSTVEHRLRDRDLTHLSYLPSMPTFSHREKQFCCLLSLVLTLIPLEPPNPVGPSGPLSPWEPNS